MTSEELNAALHELDKAGVFLGDSKIAGLYIGWFWRTVNFDQPSYRFGIIPKGTPEWTSIGPDDKIEYGPRSRKQYIGFMEKNKWDYPYTRETTPEEWANIKSLLIALVNKPSKAALKRVKREIEKVAS